MRVAVCHPRDLGSLEIKAWRSIQAAAPAFQSPFFSPEFACAVGEIDERVRVGVIEDGGEVAGFFPFRLRRRRAATLIAPGLAGGALLVRPDAPHLDFVRLLVQSGLLAWDFDDLVAPAGLGARPHVARIPVFEVDLSRGSERWLSDRRAEHRHLRRLEARRTHLAHEVGETRFTSPDPDRAALETLLAWKSAQYRATGRRDPLAHRTVLELVYQLADTRQPALAGRVSTLRAGETLVAADLSLYSGTVGSGWFTGYDHAHARHSPGMILLMAEIAAAGDRGVRRFELGSGDQDFKALLATGMAERYRGFVDRPSPQALVSRLARLPRDGAVGFVMSHPQVRGSVRAALRMIGRLRGPDRTDVRRP